MKLSLSLLLAIAACGPLPATQLDDGLLVVDVVDAGFNECAGEPDCFVPDPTNPCGRGTEDREACDRLHDAGRP